MLNVIASPLVAHTVIDTSPSVTGGTCELAFDTAGNGHVVYTNDTHNTLWYASWDGTNWKDASLVVEAGMGDGGELQKPDVDLLQVGPRPHSMEEKR